jgi:hypothetical protein
LLFFAELATGGKVRLRLGFSKFPGKTGVAIEVFG